MKSRLTDLTIQRLTLPSNGQITYWDTLTPGFGIRCSAKTKSFVVMFGERRRLKTLGKYPELSLVEARKEARRFRAQYEEHPDLLSSKPIPFVEAKDRFLADCALRNKPRTVSDYRRLLNRHFTWSSAIGEVSRRQVMSATANLAATPSEQAHAYVAIRTMMNWCVQHGFIDRSPVPSISYKSQPRDHVLSEPELKEVLSHAREFAYPFGPIISLILLTGQRRGEIAALEWNWINQVDRTITFPGSITKNKRTHVLPYGEFVAQVIETVPELGSHLFPSRSEKGTVFNGWGKAKARFDEKLEGVESYTLHDLRRTFATTHAKMGTPIHVTEKLLNHVSGAISGVAAVYNRHSYLDEMRTAMHTYDNYLKDSLSL